MQEKIRGIVLRTVKYSDSGLIIDMFTERHGRRSFATTVTRGKRGGGTALWRPLTMLEFEADLRPAGTKLPRPKDVRAYYNNVELTYHPVKSTLSLFLCEFLTHALKGESEERTLYSYLEHSFRWLDACQADYANFHLVFLMRLTRFVGIYPNLDSTSPLDWFDLSAGCFTKTQPLHPHFLPPTDAHHLHTLLRMNYETMRHFRMSRHDRSHILTVITDYYRLHIPAFPELKSLDILREIFD